MKGVMGSGEKNFPLLSFSFPSLLTCALCLPLSCLSLVSRSHASCLSTKHWESLWRRQGKLPLEPNLACIKHIKLFHALMVECVRSISNDNRTEWSPIRSVIIRVVNKRGSPICLITSMITDRTGRHEVLWPINHNFNKICDILGSFF